MTAASSGQDHPRATKRSSHAGTGFVLDPDGHVVGVYAGGAIGRLMPEDSTGLIRYLREHDAIGETL
ncbi:hypothetical protein [Streptosporangium sp. LJ11]|uniref:hypothetical protein n=1 Tax=Streptosporangium sp. LJ11 TaxID=3436927 RepID=UPI003F78BB78